MTFKDKPKRSGPKPFERVTKPKSAAPASTEAPRKRAVGAPVKTTASAAAEGAGKPERISKIMARVGVASRRDVEKIIMEGRVKLNGVTLESPAVNATLSDRIEVDGVPIRGIERTRLWLYHKPAGLVTTNSDPEGRPTVFDNLPEGLPRVLSIGRLDINTEGLLLLTNDGGLARVLELPTTGWLRRYRVRAHGTVDQEALDKLKDGIAVDGVLYGSIEATLDKVQGSNVWITMGLREGKNREIKNVMGALGLEVNRLIRISYGPFQLGELPERQVMEVRGRTLRDQLGPRLIEDAHANFDAPIFDAVGEDDAEEDAAPVRKERNTWEKPADKRERNLSRLGTRDDRKTSARPPAKPDRDAPRGGDDDRPKRRPMGQGRTANVWMAPGARPVAEKSARVTDGSEGVAEKRTPRARPEGAPATKRYGRTKDGQATQTKKRFDPDRKSAKAFSDRPDPGPRVVVKRADDDRDWIRADEPDKGDNKSFGRGDRKPRDDGDRPRKSFSGSDARSDRPRGDKPFGDKPRGDRPFGDKPRGEKSFGDKPRGAKPFGDRKPWAEGDERPRAKSFAGGDARSDKPRGAKPFGDRPRSDRPAGDRPFGDKPRGDKPYSGRPAGAKSFGAKPAGAAKPYSGRPRSDRPDGDKPSGGRPGGAASGVKRGADRRR